ncbi:MAG: hypothetical protein RIT32_340 [Actinomycetota bacterium]|jgi:energy-coupling factor transport system ATP-binding protein
MIKFENVTFRYQRDSVAVIHNFSGVLNSSEFNLVIGKTGSGKSTFLNLINGAAPHLSGGLISGDIEVFGMNTKKFQPRDFANTVGVVSQDPRNSFVTSMVEDELAYSMECLGVARNVMRQRIDESADLLGISAILQQPLEKLSAGQQQRVAIASVLVNRPQVLVLDEPTSALDPAAAEEVLSSLQRLVHDLGVSIVAAEHRLERVLQYADKVAYVSGSDGAVQLGNPSEIMSVSDIAPPIVQLGKRLGWKPLPLSVRAARDFVQPLLIKLEGNISRGDSVSQLRTTEIADLTVKYGELTALNQVSLDIYQSQTLAVLGRNGAGKSTLLAAIAGLVKPTSGKVSVRDNDPMELSGADFLQQIGLVPQEPSDLLMQQTIEAECGLTDRAGNLVAGTSAQSVAQFLPELDFGKHPLDLSEGQRLILVIALIMATSPNLLLLDEPTRGLDYEAKTHLIEAISQIERSGTSTVIATHDVELVAELNPRVAILADGRLVAQGEAREILLESIAFAPQISRAFSPHNLLTVEEALDALKLAG